MRSVVAQHMPASKCWQSDRQSRLSWVPGAKPQRHGQRHAARLCASRQQTILTDSKGNKISIDQEHFSIGSSGTADLRIEGTNVAAEHARIQQKSGRVFCTALAGDEDDILGDTFTWLNGNQLSRSVSYMVAPGTQLAFGDEHQEYTVDFEEVSNASPAMEMLMKGMASGASEDVQRRLGP